MTNMTPQFNKWFTTFISEKEVDLGEFFTNDKGVQLQTGDVVQFIISFMGEADQAKVKEKLVMIDFRNGDVQHFFRYLGNLMTEADREAITELVLGGTQ